MVASCAAEGSQKLAFEACAGNRSVYYAQPIIRIHPEHRQPASRASRPNVKAQDLIARFSQGLDPRLVGRVSEVVPFWLSLLLVILISYYIARLVWLAWPASEAQWMPPVVPGSSASQAESSFDASRIVTAHLFGVAGSEPVAAAPPPPEDDALLDAPDTRLNLRLRGAVMADEARMAHAIIADAGGTEKVYFLDDNIPGGATLQRIQLDRVILNRNGTLEVLRLPREPQRAAAAPAAAAAPRPTAPRATPRQPPAAQPAALQEMISERASGFLQIVRPAPFMPDGQLRGYRVFPGPNRERFAALGLRAGDLVTEINGMTLDDPTQGLEVFNSLGEATQLTLTVERDGQAETLNVDLAQLDVAGGATQ